MGVLMARKGVHTFVNLPGGRQRENGMNMARQQLLVCRERKGLRGWKVSTCTGISVLN